MNEKITPRTDAILKGTPPHSCRPLFNLCKEFEHELSKEKLISSDLLRQLEELSSWVKNWDCEFLKDSDCSFGIS